MQLIRTIIILLALIQGAHAQVLNIKMSQAKIKLPYWSAQRDQYGSIIIISGDRQAQGSIFLEQLAKLLAQLGWNVALLNCSKNDGVPWIAQLPEVINILRAKSDRLVLVHYGGQLKKVLDFIAKDNNTEISGLVLLSAFEKNKSLKALPEIIIPIYDIAGQFDYGPITQQQSLRAENQLFADYQMVEIPGARHEYTYHRQFLLAFMHGWMTKLTPFSSTEPVMMLSYIEPIFSLSSQVVANEESNWNGYLDNPEKVFN